MELQARAAAEELEAKENVVRSQATVITNLVSCFAGSGHLYSDFIDSEMNVKWPKKKRSTPHFGR